MPRSHEPSKDISTVRDRGETLKAHPSPATAADQVVSWVYPSEQGKERVRYWLQSHPDAHVKIDSYDVLDTDATEGRASVVVRGQACPTPDNCIPLEVASERSALKVEKSDTSPEEYTLNYGSALRLLGSGAED
ncbi:hypothetical protein [Amycolatopsis taiwanensis]|uniref:hypothetical protein n=1 Tax=Amycolatopsis taiwanensis TaxID=342230 RepID=UPI0004840657|nr:hypothetical protein [Amycolatopsis taiwanensis]